MRRIIVVLCVLACVAGVSPSAGARIRTGSGGALESKVLAAVNAGRSGKHLGALSPVGGLSAVARQHSRDMSLVRHIGHDGFRSRVAGYSAACENVAMFRPGKPVSEDAVAQKFYSLWLNSTPHRKCMFDAQHRGYTLAGVGVVKDARGAFWATLEIAKP